MTNSNFNGSELLSIADVTHSVKKYWPHILAFSLVCSLVVCANVLMTPDKYTAKVQFANSNVSPLTPQSIITKSGVVYQETASAPIDTFTIIYAIADSDSFNDNIIKKYNLTEKLPQFIDYTFSLPIEISFKEKTRDKYINELKTEGGVKKVLSNLHLNIDYRTNVYTLSSISPSREINRYLLDIYTKELNSELIQRDMDTFKKKIEFYSTTAPKLMTLASKEQFQQIIEYYERRIVELHNDVENYPLSRISFPSNLDDQLKSSPKRVVIVLGTFVASAILAFFASLAYVRSKK